MKSSASPLVVRVWLPILFTLGVYLFFRGTPPEYWLMALPLMLIPLFMATLADVQDRGSRLHVKRLLATIDIPREDVAGMAPSFMEGVGVLRLRRFVFPWGSVYFVSDWSKFGVASPPLEGGAARQAGHSSVGRVLEWLIVASSGFLASRALSSTGHLVRAETSAMRAAILTLALVLFVFFAVTRRSRPAFANIVLFMATFAAGAFWA